MNSNVDLVILAGGKGTRLKKYLNGTCKPLIKNKWETFFTLFIVPSFKILYQKYNNFSWI